MNAEEAARAGVFLVGNGAEPADLDPHVVTGHPEIRIMRALFEGLVTFDKQTFAPAPAAAESWTISPDGKVYTFKLRRNAKWSDGKPVTAHDFVYGWKRALTPSLVTQYGYFLHPVENAKAYYEDKLKDFSQVGVRAVDDYTFQVTLQQPTAQFLSMLIMPISYPVRQDVIEAFGEIDDRGTKWVRAGNLVSNGPFKLTAWRLDIAVEVERNEYYWDAKSVKLNGVHFYPIDQLQTEERLFRTGGLHVTSTVPTNRIDVYREKKDPRLKIDPYLGTYYYKFNTTRKPFDDRRVRLAFAMSIDRESIVRDVTRAGEISARCFTPPDTGGYTSRAGIDYDPEKARQLLAEAGYPNGEGLPPIELLYNTSESHKSIAEAIQDMWMKELNVRVSMANQDWKVYLANVNNLDYQVTRAGWIGDYVDASNFLECLITDGGNNNTGYANPEFDGLLKQAARTLDRDARYELFQQAEALLMRDAPLAPIYTYTRKALESSYLKGMQPNILDYYFYKDIHLEALEEVESVK